MASIGWASLQIVPSMRGVSGQITSQLTGPMQQAGRQAGEQAGRAAGEGMASGMSSAASSVERASAKLAAARDKEADAAGKVRIAELKLQELRDKGNASASQLAAAEERLATAQRGADRAQNARVQAVNDLTAARARASNAADDGEESTRRWGRSLDDFGERTRGGVDSLKNFAIAAAGIGSAVDLGMQAIENMNVESKLAAQLGATGDLAAEYGDMAGNLYRSGITSSMEEAASAIGMVANSFRTAGFEGEASMEQIAANATTFANVFDQDVSSSIQTASQLVTNGLAKDSTEAFDLMTRAFQTVPAAMREELPEILQEYGTNFRALGFDGEESFNLLVAAAEQGKFALDKTGDALKEFTIRGSDMSTASTDAFKSLGLDAAQMASQIAAGGDGAQQALQQTAQALLSVEDPADRANTAIALFGTPLEDLSVDQIPAFLQGLTGADQAMAGFAGSTQQMADTVNSGPGFAMEQLKNSIQGGLTDALGSVAQWMIDNEGPTKAMAIAVGLLAAGFVTYKAVVLGQQAATVIATAAQWAFNAALSANPIGLIITAVAALVAGLVWFFTQTEVGQKIVTAAWDAIKAGWDFMWNAVSAGLGWFGDKLASVGNAAVAAKDWIVGAWNNVVDFVTGLPGRIASAAAGMWDGIKNAFKTAINYIIQVWNALEFRIPGFEVGPIKWDGFVLGLPDLPMLAQGGPITGGTPGKDSVLAMLMPGEHVLDTGDVDAMGGQQGVYRFRAALDAGLVPKFAEGGAVVSPDQLVDFAKGVEGKPYVWGGVNWGDCSGAVSALANFATGRAPFASRFATMTEGSELAARGFKSGLGPTGSLQVGWFNGGPYGGHTAATLPNGVGFEMGGARGNGQYGGQAAKANDPMFTDHAHLPMIVAQLIQPSVEQVAPVTFPSDSGTTVAPSTGAPAGTSTGTMSTVSPSSPDAASQPTQTFSGRERFKQFGEQLGGIAADAAIEILGVGEWLDLADRYTIKADGGTTGATSGTTAAPAPPAAGLFDPKNGVLGDFNVAPLIKQAEDFLKGVGLFDTGGVWEPGTFGFNGLQEPEYVLKDAHWKTAEANVAKIDELVGAGVGGPRVQIINHNNQTIADQASWQRDQARYLNVKMMRYGGRPY